MVPVPAASVILIRETATPGFEIFMARRHIKSDFAPDVYVFPGGKADPDDGAEGTRLLLPKLPTLHGRAIPDVGWRALYMAAIRELFEESGLLLGRFEDGAWVTDLAENLKQPLTAYRDAVRTHELALATLAEQEQITLAGDHLRLFSNWITPEVLTRRFDTFFFLARLPEGASARLADEFELTDALWISPTDALSKYRDGDFPLVFATERHLDSLSSYSTIEHLWKETEHAVIEPVSPRWVLRDDGDREFVIPGDEGYESARTR